MIRLLTLFIFCAGLVPGNASLEDLPRVVSRAGTDGAVWMAASEFLEDGRLVSGVLPEALERKIEKGISMAAEERARSAKGEEPVAFVGDCNIQDVSGELVPTSFDEFLDRAQASFAGRILQRDIGVYGASPASLFLVEVDTLVKGEAPVVGDSLRVLSATGSFVVEDLRYCSFGQTMDTPKANARVLVFVTSDLGTAPTLHLAQVFFETTEGGLSFPRNPNDSLKLSWRQVQKWLTDQRAGDADDVAPKRREIGEPN